MEHNVLIPVNINHIKYIYMCHKLNLNNSLFIYLYNKINLYNILFITEYIIYILLLYNLDDHLFFFL